MAVITNNVYLFLSSGVFNVPSGVTRVQIECYGASRYVASDSSGDAIANHGPSYSKIFNFDVSASSTLTVTVGANNGFTWVSKTGSQPTNASQGCLAYGGAQTPTYQKANNIGDVIFPGGLGVAVTGINGAIGGPGGPNGPGATIGNPYTSGGTVASGGGANGGSQGDTGFYPYGRTGSGVVLGGGNGAFDGSTPTLDVVVQASYIGNNAQSSLYNYGPSGGASWQRIPACTCGNYQLLGQNGFAVITLIYPEKYIVITNPGTSSLVLPSDCASIQRLIAVGAGGNGLASATNSRGGGGGGGYSETLNPAGSAGSTIWYQLPASGAVTSAYIKVGGVSNIPPVNNTQGVLANSGANAVTITGGVGGSVTGAIGTTTYIGAGGAGGNGAATLTHRNHGGGGGPAYRNSDGGAGGAGYPTTAARGSGGGGSVGGTNGNIGTNTAGGNGGGSSNGVGAVGATGSATSGTNGGGGGGGFGTTNINGRVGSGLSIFGGIATIGSGSGGNAASGTVYAGAGGSGGTTSATTNGGNGLLIIIYNTNPYAPPATNGNFLQFS